MSDWWLDWRNKMSVNTFNTFIFHQVKTVSWFLIGNHEKGCKNLLDVLVTLWSIYGSTEHTTSISLHQASLFSFDLTTLTLTNAITLPTGASDQKHTYLGGNYKQCVLAFSLEDTVDNVCSFLNLQSIQWWRPACLFYAKLNYEQRVFKRHFSKRISARSHFNAGFLWRSRLKWRWFDRKN